MGSSRRWWRVRDTAWINWGICCNGNWRKIDEIRCCVYTRAGRVSATTEGRRQLRAAPERAGAHAAGQAAGRNGHCAPGDHDVELRSAKVLRSGRGADAFVL